MLLEFCGMMRASGSALETALSSAPAHKESAKNNLLQLAPRSRASNLMTLQLQQCSMLPQPSVLSGTWVHLLWCHFLIKLTLTPVNPGDADWTTCTATSCY